MFPTSGWSRHLCLRLSYTNSESSPMARSDIEEHSLLFAAEVYVKVPMVVFTSELRQKGRPASCRHESENRILLVGGVIGKIDARGQPLQNPASKDRHINMRRLQRAVIAGNPARLDGFKPADASRIGRQATKANKPWIKLFALKIVGMVVPALSIGLPDFDHRIVHGRAMAIQHAAEQADSFALGRVGYQAADGGGVGDEMKERTDCLRWDGLHVHVIPRRAWRRVRAK